MCSLFFVVLSKRICSLFFKVWGGENMFAIKRILHGMHSTTRYFAEKSETPENWLENKNKWVGKIPMKYTVPKKIESGCHLDTYRETKNVHTLNGIEYSVCWHFDLVANPTPPPSTHNIWVRQTKGWKRGQQNPNDTIWGPKTNSTNAWDGRIWARTHSPED